MQGTSSRFIYDIEVAYTEINGGARLRCAFLSSTRKESDVASAFWLCRLGADELTRPCILHEKYIITSAQRQASAPVACGLAMCRLPWGRATVRSAVGRCAV